ncbi:MAG TPA: sulfatase-like hydrolase/transferase, partial [Longimicrobiaceae bacterium]|nr:sulfatase-like hydrolase/transferase [Longimicrobiaceae bacterium]
VNPHDVHVYTMDWQSAGYPAAIPDMGIGWPPRNHYDTLDDKPRVQRAFRSRLNGSAGFILDPSATPPTTEEGYANFYAYLQTVVDAEIGKVLDTLDTLGLTDSTLVVRMADHGEMGMSHGLREKMYTAYDEAIHVPLIFSNPLAFPQGVATDAFASLLDLLPTLASMVGLPPQKGLYGQDLTPVLSGARPSVQDDVLYAYDDQFFVFAHALPTNIRAVRTPFWMYAVYFSEANPDLPLEFELYDMVNDPGQLKNLLSPRHFDPAILPDWLDLNKRLIELVTRNDALPPNVLLPPPEALGLALLETVDAPFVLAEVAGEPWLEGK